MIHLSPEVLCLKRCPLLWVLLSPLGWQTQPEVNELYPEGLLFPIHQHYVVYFNICVDQSNVLQSVQRDGQLQEQRSVRTVREQWNTDSFLT